MYTITFHLFSTVRPVSDGTDYFYYLELFVAFCPPKTFQNDSLCLGCGSSEQSLCSTHKELKSEWRSASAPMPYLTCVHT